MTQPNTLRLADSISRIDTLTDHQRSELLQAAAELRRLHAANLDCMDHFNALKHDYDAVIAQRNELLVALKNLDANPDMLSAWLQARAAIAKAEKP